MKISDSKNTTKALVAAPLKASNSYSVVAKQRSRSGHAVSNSDIPAISMGDILTILAVMAAYIIGCTLDLPGGIF